MRLIRLYAAIDFLRGAVIVAGIIAGPALTETRVSGKPTFHLAERILLASLTALAVYFVWTSIGRAWS